MGNFLLLLFVAVVVVAIQELKEKMVAPIENVQARASLRKLSVHNRFVISRRRKRVRTP